MQTEMQTDRGGRHAEREKEIQTDGEMQIDRGGRQTDTQSERETDSGRE